MIYWLTGQPGSGKTTLGDMLAERLRAVGTVARIEGEAVRKMFGNEDYSRYGRVRNVADAWHLARFYNSKGPYDAIVTMVSPYRDQRNRYKIGAAEFKEIYCHTTEIRGREHFFAEGYEPPTENFIDLDTGILTPEQCVQKILNL